VDDNTITSDGSEHIIPTFNINTWKIIHVVCVYEAYSCSFFTFLNNFQTLIQHSPEHCPIIIMGDFNVDILKDNNQTKKNQELLNFMAKFQFKSQFKFSQTDLYCIQITKHTSNV
jgi:endonuclease/exonuclease/phosphatase family metal-dependent hydrolase